MRSLFGALAIFVMAQASALAWGTEGHSIVAEIAQRRLDPAVAEKVRAILGNGGSLASVSSWADDYRSLHRETSGWHFVDIPLDQQDYDEARDCSSTTNGDCVVHAIERATAALKDPAAPGPDRTMALKFLVHFVGDINQPLHTVKELQGYNLLAVCYFSSPAKNDCAPTNLHAVWDSGLIRSIFYDWGAYADYLDTTWIPNQDSASLEGGAPADWALEAHRLAREVVVNGINADAHLGKPYLDLVRPTLDRQLAVSGLRLARLLNDTLR